MTLPSVGTLSYGSVVFGNTVGTKVSSKPVYDPANRTTVAVDHTIRVKSYVMSPNGTSSTDGVLATLHTALMTPGQTLHYDSKGAGGADGVGIHVNDGSGPWDVSYGPHPELLDFTPYGNLGALVDWSVTTRIPTMCSGAKSQFALMMLNYEVDYTFDESGLLRLTVQGSYEIPATRQTGSSRSIPDTADSYRERIYGEVPNGFRRTPPGGHWHLSTDKRTMEFNWTDMEMSAALPEDCVTVEAHQRVKWSLANAATFYCTIDATITTTPDVSPITAMDRFKAIVAGRIAGANKFKNGLPLVLKAAENGTILLNDFEVDESIFGRTSRFSCGYTIIGGDFKSIAQAAGLYLNIPDVDFATWKASMKPPAFNPRGLSGVRFSNSDDAILDLCVPSVSILKGQTPPTRQNILRGNPGQQNVLIADPDIAGFRAVRPDKTWMQYQCAIRLIEDDRIAVHKPLTGAANVTANATGQALTTAQVFANLNPAGGSTSPGARASTADIIQRVSAPSYRVRLTGYALRLGYHIPEPRLMTIGGQTATQTDQDVSETVATAVNGIPIYLKTWDIGYVIAGTPTSPIKTPANPAVDTDAA